MNVRTHTLTHTHSPTHTHTRSQGSQGTVAPPGPDCRTDSEVAAAHAWRLSGFIRPMIAQESVQHTRQLGVQSVCRVCVCVSVQSVCAIAYPARFLIIFVQSL